MLLRSLAIDVSDNVKWVPQSQRAELYGASEPELPYNATERRAMNVAPLALSNNRPEEAETLKCGEYARFDPRLTSVEGLIMMNVACDFRVPEPRPGTSRQGNSESPGVNHQAVPQAKGTRTSPNNLHPHVWTLAKGGGRGLGGETIVPRGGDL